QDRSSASAVHRPHPARLPEPVICLSIKKPASAGFLMLPRQVAHEIVGAPPSGRTDYSARSRLLPPAQYLYCLLGAVATHLGIGHEPGTHSGALGLAEQGAALVGGQMDTGHACRFALRHAGN